MTEKLSRPVDMQMVHDYWKQGRLRGKQLFGGRIILFLRDDVEDLIEELAHEPSKGEQQGSANGLEK